MGVLVTTEAIKRRECRCITQRRATIATVSRLGREGCEICHSGTLSLCSIRGGGWLTTEHSFSCIVLGTVGYKIAGSWNDS